MLLRFPCNVIPRRVCWQSDWENSFCIMGIKNLTNLLLLPRTWDRINRSATTFNQLDFSDFPPYVYIGEVIQFTLHTFLCYCFWTKHILAFFVRWLSFLHTGAGELDRYGGWQVGDSGGALKGDGGREGGGGGSSGPWVEGVQEVARGHRPHSVDRRRIHAPEFPRAGDIQGVADSVLADHDDLFRMCRVLHLDPSEGFPSQGGVISGLKNWEWRRQRLLENVELKPCHTNVFGWWTLFWKCTEEKWFKFLLQLNNPFKNQLDVPWLFSTRVLQWYCWWCSKLTSFSIEGWFSCFIYK